MVLALRAEGRAVDAFTESLSPFGTDEAPDGVVDIASRVDSVGAQTVPLPRVEGTTVRGERLRAELRGDTLAVSEVEGGGEVANAFRWLLAELLLRRDAVLIHGVGFAQDGRAALFTGASGAGKSTLGLHGRAGGLTLMGDELVAVRAGVTAHAYGTPWNTGANVDGALMLMGTLGWTAAPQLVEGSASALLRMACENVLLPRDDAQSRARVATVLVQVIGAVRPVRLDFAPGPDVADVVRAGLAP